MFADFFGKFRILAAVNHPSGFPKDPESSFLRFVKKLLVIATYAEPITKQWERMSFFYFKSKDKTFDPESVICENADEKTIVLADHAVIKYVETCESHSVASGNIIFCGRIFYDGADQKQSIQRWCDDIDALNWPLPDTVSGYFSGFYIRDNKVTLFTDPVGLHHLYYFADENQIIIASSLAAIHKAVPVELNPAGMMLETCHPFIQYGKITILEGVNRLFPGELIELTDYSITQDLFDLTIKAQDGKPSANFANEVVELINSESNLFYNQQVLISMSGGIDSRINLAPLLANKKKFRAINYGSKEIIDSSIPSKIAEKFDFEIDLIDPMPNLFPKPDFIDRLIENTDSLYINMWNSILRDKKYKKGTVFLIGDMIDILRAKNISSLKTRQFRTSFFIKKFLLGKKLALSPLTAENLAAFKTNKRQALSDKVKDHFKYFYFDDTTKMIVLQKVIADLDSLFSHIDKYNCAYLESYEELFGIFTAGRLSMGKQLNMLNYKFCTEVPLVNIKILRKVLNISPAYRYADELTSAMFKHPSWKMLGQFPTAQSPLVNYNSNYYLMLFGWFLRSKIDLFLIKTSLYTKGKFKRTRLFKMHDYHETYAYPEAFENYCSYFEENDYFKFQEKIDLFKSRMKRKSWPLASMDLMPFVQVMHYVKKFR